MFLVSGVFGSWIFGERHRRWTGLGLEARQEESTTASAWFKST
jgi:hypothetical protein